MSIVHFPIHRLWSIPVDGFAALLRKLVSNESLLGYLTLADPLLVN